jgi:hypothetical protein
MPMPEKAVHLPRLESMQTGATKGIDALRVLGVTPAELAPALAMVELLAVLVPLAKAEWDREEAAAERQALLAADLANQAEREDPPEAPA